MSPIVKIVPGGDLRWLDLIIMEQAEYYGQEMPLAVDLHKQRAAEMFEVPIEEVTPEQRRIGKLDNYRKMYGTKGAPR